MGRIWALNSREPKIDTGDGFIATAAGKLVDANHDHSSYSTTSDDANQPLDVSMCSRHHEPKSHESTVKNSTWSVPGLLSNVTIEPAIFLFTFSFMVYNPVFDYMIMNKLCLQYFGYPADQCQAFGKGQNLTVDTSVQKVWAVFDNYSTILGTFPGLMFALFIGPWSDEYGRKPLLVVPFIGIMMSSVLSILLEVMPSLPIWMLFVPTFALSFFGSMAVFMTGAFASAADVTSAYNRSRAVRIAVIDICRTTGFSLALIVSAALAKNRARFYLCYVAALLTTGIGLIYTIVFMRETRFMDRGYTLREAFGRLFNIRHLADSLETTLKKRPSQARLTLWILLVAFIVYSVTLSGEEQINQKFFMAAPLSWSLSYYLYFQAAWGLFNMLVVGLFTAFVQKHLKLADSTLGILGCVSRILFGTVIAMAQSTWMVFLANWIGVLKFASLIAMRALMSNLVLATEQGKLLSLLSLFEGLSPSIGSAMMTSIFTTTLDWWPGYFSFVGACTTFIPLTLLVLASYHKKLMDVGDVQRLPAQVACI